MDKTIKTKDEITEIIRSKKKLEIVFLDEADLLVSLIDNYHSMIEETNIKYEEELNILKSKFNIVNLVNQKESLELALNEFASNERKSWSKGTSSIELNTAVLKFKATPPKIKIDVPVATFVKKLKIRFPKRPNFYKDFIDVKISFKLNEIKRAVKIGVLDDDFTKENKIIVKGDERLEIKMKRDKL